MRRRSELTPSNNVVPIAQAAPARPWVMPEGLRDIALTGQALLDEDDERDDFVVHQLIARDDLVLLKGQEKKGLKTWLALRLAIARIVGGLWLGMRVERCTDVDSPPRVLFVSAETSARQIARRVRAICKAENINPESIAEYLVVVDTPISLVPRAERERIAGKAHLTTALAAEKIYDADRRKNLHKSASQIAEHEANALGQQLDALAAIENAPKGTWALIIVDTLRATLVGDENSSADAARYMQTARELARIAGCPVVIVHHTNKVGHGSESRSSRGSTELTAAPDTIVNLDVSGEWPTASFELRNHPAPGPIGYALVASDEGGAKIEVRAATSKVDDGEVLAVLQEHAPDVLTITNIRKLVAERHGGKEGAKSAPGPILDALDRLVAGGQASKAPIKGRGGKTYQGWRAGKDSRPDSAKRIATSGPLFGDPHDV